MMSYNIYFNLNRLLPKQKFFWAVFNVYFARSFLLTYARMPRAEARGWADFAKALAATAEMAWWPAIASAKAGYCFGEFRHPETQSGCPVREHREASLFDDSILAKIAKQTKKKGFETINP